MDWIDRIFIGVVALIIACWLLIRGYDAGTGAEREKAIAAGVGRWTVDAKTGERTFLYGAAKEAAKP